MTASCGCKGIRSCAVCENSERVKNLIKTEKTYSDFNFYIFDKTRNVIVPTNCLDMKSSLEEIRKETIRASSIDSADFFIDGLLQIPDFLSSQEEFEILEMIAKVDWASSQSGRRKQDYGPKVNFKHKKVKWDSFHGMPQYADFLLEKMRDYDEELLGNYLPFEMCNLEYEECRKSGIELHQDDMWIWGNRLISINLINGTVMTLVNEEQKKVVFVEMPHRSLICMANECRYDWKHGVLPHHITDRRIALTMREAAKDFQEGGSLYEKFGKELIRIARLRVNLE